MLASRHLTIAGVIVLLENDNELDQAWKWQLLTEALAGKRIEASGNVVEFQDVNLYLVTKA